LRLGVSGVREQAEALAGRAVVEVTAAERQLPDAPVLVGTEAVLYREAEVHKTGGASVVAFLDFDQDLLAPRYRAGEEALALLAKASRLVGGRAGTVIVQTRSPAHPVLKAALLADPGRLADAEQPVRRGLRLPPYSSLALLSGPGAQELSESLRAWARGALVAQGDLAGALKVPDGLNVREGGAGEHAGWLELNDLAEGRWLVRASSYELLADALAAAGRPKTTVRVEVGPARL
jgi:primosomal protein N' (replication factor Y)